MLDGEGRVSKARAGPPLVGRVQLPLVVAGGRGGGAVTKGFSHPLYFIEGGWGGGRGDLLGGKRKHAAAKITHHEAALAKVG